MAEPAPLDHQPGASAANPDCPVCRGVATRAFLDLPAEARTYWRCGHCQATFLDPACRPDPAAERAHYLTHDNRVDDPAYRAFLARLATPLLDRLAPAPLDGLDYGCGPGPALAHMLREAGHRIAVYDPFFADDPAVLRGTYDFITCTETAEHFHDPAAEFDRFDRLLQPGGWLGVMTCFQTDDAAFRDWHYRRDPTHVVFYKRETLEVLAEARNWSFECPVKDVAVMRKPN
jgi:SAM-dependent methyltransferase